METYLPDSLDAVTGAAKVTAADTLPNAELAKLNEKECTILELLSIEVCYGFAYLENVTGLSRSEVCRACRSLARKGLAEYHRGLFNDEGDVAGSGYCASRAGERLVA